MRSPRPRPLAVEPLEDRALPAPLTVPGVVTVQSPLLVLGSGPGGGEVRAIDPTTGQTTLDFFPFGSGFTGGVNVASADLTGDAVPDVVAGMASGGSAVNVFDGATGAAIRGFDAFGPGFVGGVNLAVGPLAAGGGWAIVAGAGAGGGPHVKVFDAATGAVVRSFYAFDPNFSGGVNVAVGYLDRDFTPDIIAGAGPGGGPNVRVFDGATGIMARSFFAYAPTFAGGVTVATVGRTADGLTDIVTGAGATAPHVKVFDAVTGAEARSFYAFPGAGFGVTVAAADLGTDRNEVVVGARSGGGAAVKAFDAATGAETRTLTGFPAGTTVASASAVYTIEVPPPEPVPVSAWNGSDPTL